MSLSAICVICLFITMSDMKLIGKNNKKERENLIGEIEEKVYQISGKRGKGASLAKGILACELFFYFVGITAGIVQISINIYNYILLR